MRPEEWLPKAAEIGSDPEGWLVKITGFLNAHGVAVAVIRESGKLAAVLSDRRSDVALGTVSAATVVELDSELVRWHADDLTSGAWELRAMQRLYGPSGKPPGQE